MSLKPISFKVNDSQKELINKAVKLNKEKNKGILKGEAITNIAISYLTIQDELIPTDEVTPELILKEEMDLPSLCPARFLKKIVDHKDGINKWYCLRSINPESKGKPLIIGDGKDIKSVRKYCDACKSGYDILESKRRTHDTVLAIRKFGESEIKVEMYVCTHPDLPYYQVVGGPKREMICELRNKRVLVDKICLADKVNPCEFIQMTPVIFDVKDTEAYKQFDKALEYKQHDDYIENGTPIKDVEQEEKQNA